MPRESDPERVSYRQEVRQTDGRRTETGETYDAEYEYEVEVEYKYYILNVTLTNTSIGVVARGSGLTEDQLERYDVLMEIRLIHTHFQKRKKNVFSKAASCIYYFKKV